MTEHLAFLILGLGSGAVYAALGMALVVTYRSSGVVNFATGAVALYVAYTFAFLRKGELLLPVPGLKQSLSLGAPQTLLFSLVVSLAVAAMLGLLLYGLVFRPLRAASPVAKAVASIGVMLLVQALLAQRVGTNPVSVQEILPGSVYTWGDVRVPADRLWFAGIVIALGVALTLSVRFTRFGLATRAVAESERGALVSGLSPDRIAAMNWAMSSVVAGLSGILIAPIVPLIPLSYTLFIVPALAAALAGGFTRLGPAILAGLAIGMLQSEATYLQATWDWFPSAGTAELIPLLVILILLVLRGDRLPRRGSLLPPSLGRAPRPRGVLLPLAALVPAVVLLMATDGSVRAAVITSFVFGVLGLSQVVVTGYAGQVSLAQLAVAGVAAFSLTRLTTDAGLPFPVAPILAALIATAIGVLVGLPALRLRGLPVAVVTLAMAVTVEAAWFRNADFNGGLTGAPIEPPSLFGMELGIGAGEGYPRIAFGLLCLAVLTLVALGTARLRTSRLGASMLAVRANERSAAAAGIDVRRVKVAAFAIGSFIAAIGGTLIGYQQNVASASSFTALGGIGLFAMVYLAGVSSVAGGITAGLIASGGIVFLALDRWIGFGTYFGIVMGLLLVVTVIRNPEGIVGPLHDLAARFRQRPSPGPAAEAQALDLQTVEPPGNAVLTVGSVGVRYGGVVALEDVSFEVREGEILGLIGPNGAGKTTLVDALSGYARCTGSVSLDGRGLDGLPPHRRSRGGLGRTFQGIELYDDLTVRENVLVGTVAAVSRAGAGRAPEPDLDRLFGTLELTDVADRPVAELSQGRRQLVSVARALAGRPKVVLLDEPAAGLDSAESRWLGERLRAARSGGVTVVMVEHDMGLVLDVCDRVVVLDLGRVIAVGTPEEIKADPAVVAAYLGGAHPPEPAAQTEEVPS
ncbi:amino acid/amide ABC transporter membrane protein 1 (HAAT family) /amino acid/amide ABC transporter membrane protein 2 (HAAT family) /amino acid/amide ABC transporter ATP-binding protein 1 (HAAT family) [Actinocorallia herbida]|uniref:ABC transporter domain-containing protein n=1 Tax=Actinocorallia herbida TaxID=58109 RepID=A0A3N1D2Y6_9ACTN|nr:branched-chain amino acid ABC transporter permease/ATP-binding protein [Actinocorallia herbida]ROO87889.1 amino acid/amide ABC transporter membrane protein 1 (HAAT family) /amino acid/amide ABC transporter membrane protein 2 (HAAT family) /amino acid/amide ABC transporter ATP-binding protein 1 (HAAT family) [Actinocorallia herbida]